MILDLPAPPDVLLPREGEVLVFVVSLEVDEARLLRFERTFPERERVRADAFATPLLRRRWVAGRGALRELLGGALSIAPAEVAFSYGSHGKPSLHPRCAPAGAALTFNTSHSGERALYALSRGCELGVDIELPRARRTDDIARRFFTEGEKARLFAHADDEARRAAFFALWTCKEAFMKATGEGLSRSTRSFDVEVRGAQARLCSVDGDAETAARWSVYRLEPGDGYAAALFAQGKGHDVRVFRWPR